MTTMFWRKKEKPPTLAEGVSRSYCAPFRVLFVDDNHLLREVLIRMAETEFMLKVTGAATVNEARALLMAGTYDAAILDQVLTNGEGIDLYAEILSRELPMDVIFFTGFNSEEFRRRVEAIGPARVYSKPSGLDLRFLCQLFEQLGAPHLAH